MAKLILPKTQSMSKSKSLQFDSARIGSLSYSEDEIYNFPSGLKGFEHEKHFLLCETENVKPFVWLQSLANKDLAFLLCDPRTFIPDFKLEAHRADLPDVELNADSETMVFVIITVPENPKGMTANLKGPVVLNLTQKKGQQVVVENGELKFPLFRD